MGLRSQPYQFEIYRPFGGAEVWLWKGPQIEVYLRPTVIQAREAFREALRR